MTVAKAFSPGVATFYAGPNEHAGGSGGACGFEDDGLVAPYNGLTAAGNNDLFKSGAGCGTCYQVKCTENMECSGYPVPITITNECPGACNDQHFHFDLSYKAFRLLAKRGQGFALQKHGIINIQYRRVQCSYRWTPIVFRIAKGSIRGQYLAFASEFVNGDGDVGAVELIVSKNNVVLPMTISYGATWATGFSIPDTSIGPYSVRLTTIESGRTILATNVIPADWAPGQEYRSSVNF
ncbi:expansin-B6-like [Olea europaea var. sylvestris]|uniref:expansin-B6-like n=1 Tax=Olea europaea var. sylvestris TaxID=158386 RepID=UPI000C1D0D51|nr:expansin-B6-like [Olea europaea var. sylvestris]